MMACCLEWLAPRFDAPDSVNVRHVCKLPRYHEQPCECSCGATRSKRQRRSVLDSSERPLERP